MFSVSTYYDGILFLKLKPICQRDIYHFLVLMKVEQLSISGNVVNVPADVMSTVNKLPRMLTEDETIALKFKRSLNFNSVAFERIRPNKVLNAAKWLVENIELFRNEGI